MTITEAMTKLREDTGGKATVHIGFEMTYYPAHHGNPAMTQIEFDAWIGNIAHLWGDDLDLVVAQVLNAINPPNPVPADIDQQVKDAETSATK